MHNKQIGRLVPVPVPVLVHCLGAIYRSVLLRVTHTERRLGLLIDDDGDEMPLQNS